MRLGGAVPTWLRVHASLLPVVWHRSGGWAFAQVVMQAHQVSWRLGCDRLEVAAAGAATQAEQHGGGQRCCFIMDCDPTQQGRSRL